MAELDRQKDLVGYQERQSLHRETSNIAWIIVIPHHLNVAELSWEEFQDNLCLIYGLMPRKYPQPTMVVVNISRFRTPYHFQRVVLFCFGITIL